MNSVRIDGDHGSVSSINDGKNYKSHDNDAFDNVSVPRKQRSDIKKRPRESIISPLQKKKRCMSNGVETLKQNGAKKSKQIMKRKGQITKDETEVAEILYNLANMFTDRAEKTKKPPLDGEQNKTISSTIVGVESSRITAQVREMNTRAGLEAERDYPVWLKSAAQVAESQTFGIVKQAELPFIKQSATPSAFGVNCYSSYPKEEKLKGVFQSSTGFVGSETKKSSLGFSVWLKSSNSTAPTADKIPYPRAMLESENSWKECGGNVNVALPINALQKSDGEENGFELTANRSDERWPYTSIDNQRRGINGADNVYPFNGFTHYGSERYSGDNLNGILSFNRGQQQASRTSAMSSSLINSSIYSSMAGGGFSSAASEGINRAAYTLEGVKQNLAPYQQPQNYCRDRVSATSQVQLPPNQSNNAQPLPQRTNPGGEAVQQLQEWLNRPSDSPSYKFAESLLNSSLGSSYRHLSPVQRIVMSGKTLSNPVEYSHYAGLERNGFALRSDILTQLQLQRNQPGAEPDKYQWGVT